MTADHPAGEAPRQFATKSPTPVWPSLITGVTCWLRGHDAIDIEADLVFEGPMPTASNGTQYPRLQTHYRVCLCRRCRCLFWRADD